MFLLFTFLLFWVWGILRRWSACAPTACEVVRDCRKFEKHSFSCLGSRSLRILLTRWIILVLRFKMLTSIGSDLSSLNVFVSFTVHPSAFRYYSQVFNFSSRRKRVIFSIIQVWTLKCAVACDFLQFVPINAQLTLTFLPNTSPYQQQTCIRKVSGLNLSWKTKDNRQHLSGVIT
jgi:hypothetical protein